MKLSGARKRAALAKNNVIPWKETQPGLWEGKRYGVEFIISDDGNFTIDCGRKSDRTVIVTDSFRTIAQAKQQAEGLISTIAVALRRWK